MSARPIVLDMQNTTFMPRVKKSGSRRQSSKKTVIKKNVSKNATASDDQRRIVIDTFDLNVIVDNEIDKCALCKVRTLLYALSF